MLLGFLTDSKYRFSRNRTGVQKFASKCVLQIGVKLWSQKKMSLVILFTLTAYRTTTLNLCNGTLWINISFGHFTYPLRRKLESSLNKTVGCISTEYTPRRYEFTKFSLAARSVPWSFWTTVIFQGGKCSIFATFCADIADTPFCYANRGKIFLVMCPI